MSDQDQWVIVRLSRRGENQPPEKLQALLKKELPGDTSIFIPSVTYEKGESSYTIWLMEGYVFIKAGLRMARYFDLETTSYVASVLTIDKSGNRHIRFIDDEQIEEMRQELRKKASRDIDEGDEVKIKEGTYAEMNGEVIGFSDDHKQATVEIQGMRTRQPEVELPVVFLEKS